MDHQPPLLFRALVLRLEADQLRCIDEFGRLLETPKFSKINTRKNKAILRSMVQLPNAIERAQLLCILLATNEDFAAALMGHASGPLRPVTQRALHQTLHLYGDLLARLATNEPGVILQRVAQVLVTDVVPDDVAEAIRELQITPNLRTCAWLTTV